MHTQPMMVMNSALLNILLRQFLVQVTILSQLIISGATALRVRFRNGIDLSVIVTLMRNKRVQLSSCFPRMVIIETGIENNNLAINNRRHVQPYKPAMSCFY